MEEQNSVLGGSRVRQKPPTLIGSHTTTERTNRRKEQDIRMALERGGFAGLGKDGERCKYVVGREPTSKGEKSCE
jgi:hypothetical protein